MLKSSTQQAHLKVLLIFDTGRSPRKIVPAKNMRLLSLVYALLGRSPASNTQILPKDRSSRLAMRKNGIKGKFKLGMALIASN